MSTMEVDGVAVGRVESPGSPQELSEAMKLAFEREATMLAVGGASRLHLGNTPRSADVAVRTSGLQGVVEYEPDNMTVSVLAGTPLRQLQDTLRQGGQFLPLDPPLPDRSTVGGIVACNMSGPIRFRYGTVRDMLIGVKIVHADGTMTKAGGKLVKNVTGYDMCKLYTGSLGTLGILSELTLKVQPLPKTVETAFLRYPTFEKAMESTQHFLRSELLPDAIEAWNPEGARSIPGAPVGGNDSWILSLRFGDVEAAVRWQMDRLKQAVPETGGEILGILSREESLRFWEGAASAREDPSKSAEVLVKCSVLYQTAPETARLLEEIGGPLGARTSIFCHAGTYVLFGRLAWDEGTGIPSETLRKSILALRARCVASGGHAVIEKSPREVKNGLDVWGYDAPALEIMRKIKNEFDPKGLLNPGRFVGGI